MIYDIDATSLTSGYDDSGLSTSAFDKGGSTVLSKTITKTIMSYNVQKWQGYNGLKSIQDIAFSYGADIVGIQEWGTSAAQKIEGEDSAYYLNNEGYENVYITIDDRNHKAIASKNILSDYEEVVYDQWLERRSYTKAYFKMNGHKVALFNTHFDYQTDSAEKFAQAQELLDAVQGETYFVIMGDLNTACTDKNSTEYQSIVQPFIDAGYNVGNSPTGDPLIWTYYNGKTAATSTSIRPTDNIITSANITLGQADTIDTKLTAGLDLAIDHLPLVATITL